MCRTRVARSPCKRVSHPSSTSSVKDISYGKQGQHWFLGLRGEVRKASKVNIGSSACECNTARSARRASQVNIGSSACEASQLRCCSGLSPLAVLGGEVKTWRGVKTRSLEELKW